LFSSLLFSSLLFSSLLFSSLLFSSLLSASLISLCVRWCGFLCVFDGGWGPVTHVVAMTTSCGVTGWVCERSRARRRRRSTAALRDRGLGIIPSALLSSCYTHTHTHTPN